MKRNYKNPLVVTTVLVALFAIAYFTYTSFFGRFGNYAKDAARPLEKSLIKNGATKKCDGGDGGHGSDNRSPHYGSTFLVAIDKDQAISLIQKIAKDNGYNLQHASPTNRDPLGFVPDEFINDWYFDVSSRQSTYRELQPGNVKLVVSVKSVGSNIGCDQGLTPAGHSLIGVGIELPSFK